MQITIHIPKRYVEVVEIHRSRETGSVFVQVTLVKAIEPYSGHKGILASDFRRHES